MDRKEISAFLIGCEPDQLMAFKNYGDDGVAAIGPDGKKYIYSVEFLDQAEAKRKAAEQAAKPAKPAKRPGRSRSRDAGRAPAKRAARPKKTGTGKPAARSSAACKKK